MVMLSESSSKSVRPLNYRPKSNDTIARFKPLHLAQMNQLETDDPSTREALKSGDFVVSKAEDMTENRLLVHRS